ncbi:MAG TPA: hypothetical protein VEQ34_10980, partial [Pyrinomonadaceae bacterium]|nr:hypothetical protein [Pyrinomonadaceae bacterium]
KFTIQVFPKTQKSSFIAPDRNVHRAQWLRKNLLTLDLPMSELMKAGWKNGKTPVIRLNKALKQQPHELIENEARSTFRKVQSRLSLS